MQGPEFRAGIDALLALAARRGPVALMCAETCYWQVGGWLQRPAECRQSAGRV